MAPCQSAEIAKRCRIARLNPLENSSGFDEPPEFPEDLAKLRLSFRIVRRAGGSPFAIGKRGVEWPDGRIIQVDPLNAARFANGVALSVPRRVGRLLFYGLENGAKRSGAFVPKTAALTHPVVLPKGFFQSSMEASLPRPPASCPPALRNFFVRPQGMLS